jgi:tetratricopeptide (TPR) repeat protein
MFLYIPLLIFVASLAALAIIIWKKWPFLKKLSSSDSIEIEPEKSSDLFSEFFPELKEYLKDIKINEYKDMWLLEIEKFLRRLRVLSLRVDRASGTLIRKIREVNSDTVSAPVQIASKEQVSVEGQDKKSDSAVIQEQLKKDEQKLILEIAKNPKDAKLYVSLAELYIQLGNFSDAKESYDAAIELDPNNEELKMRRSKIVEMMV